MLAQQELFVRELPLEIESCHCTLFNPCTKTLYILNAKQNVNVHAFHRNSINLRQKIRK